MRHRFRIAIVSIGWLLASPVSAEPFAIAASNSNAAFVVDRGAMVRDGSIVRGWYYVIDRVVGSDGGDFLAVNFEMDCTEYRERMLYLTRYTLEGRSLQSGEASREWRPAMPGTGGYGVLVEVCKPDNTRLLLEPGKKPPSLLDVAKAARRALQAGAFKAP